MSDPVTQGIRRGAAVFGFLKAWRMNRRERRKAKKTGQAVPVETEEMQMGLILELIGSLARTTLPVATAFLEANDIHITGSSTTTTLLIVGLWGGAQAWSWIRKIRNKPRNVEAKPAA